MTAKFKSLLRDQAFQNVLGLAVLASVIYGLSAGLVAANHTGAASAVYAVALVFALMAGIGLVLLVAEHFGARPRTNFFRRFQIRSPLMIVRPVTAAPIPIEPTHTIWKGLRWKWNGRHVRAYCPEPGHESYALVFENGHETADHFLAQFRGDTNRLRCAAGDGHLVDLDGQRSPTSMQFDAAALEAATRLRAGG